jgi:hypothetical protein
MTDLRKLQFDDGATLVVILRDGHTFSTVNKLDLQDHGLMFEDTGGNGPGTERLFIPYEFVQSVSEQLS